MSRERTPERERLLDLIDKIVGRKVLMSVDLVVDRFITGTPKRISREAPVLILRQDGDILIPGGGANAVANVAALEGKPLPLGVVGDDEAGQALCRMFSERGISTDGILIRKAYRTPTKTRVLAGGRHAIKQQIVRFDVEDDLELTDAEKATLVRSALADGQPEAAVFSDYGYGAVDPSLLSLLLREQRDDLPFLGDSRYRLQDFAGLTGATPNLEEAEALAQSSLEGPASALEQGGDKLRRRLGLEFLLITRGSSGMSLFTASGIAHLPVSGTDQVADVTGAGDTVIGTFALALAARATPLEAACLANYAAGVVVMKMGTATLSREELRAAVLAGAAPLEKMQWVEF